MKFRVTCRVCNWTSDSESPSSRAQEARKHTVEKECIPLWDVRDVEETVQWQSA